MSCVWSSTVHANGDCIWTETPADFTPAERCVWASTVHAKGGCIWTENIIVTRKKGKGGGPDIAAERELQRIFREDEEILAILMAYTLH